MNVDVLRGSRGRISGAQTMLEASSRPSPHHADRSRDGMADYKTIPDSLPNEHWLEIPGWCGLYFISDIGRVFSTRTGRILRARNSRGYRVLMLRDAPRKKISTVHSLVMAAFVGDRPKGHHINHLDGDKANNHLSNLEYCTPRENDQHAWRIGLRTAEQLRGLNLGR